MWNEVIIIGYEVVQKKQSKKNFIGQMTACGIRYLRLPNKDNGRMRYEVVPKQKTKIHRGMGCEVVHHQTLIFPPYTLNPKA
jgi:hypothetical protein